MALVVGYNGAIMLVEIFACTPIEKSWDATILTGHCVNRAAVYLSNAILNIVTDLIILLQPLPMVRRMHVPLRQKILLAAIFSVGSL